MKFSEQFIEVLDDLAAKMGVVIDWSQENVVPYVMDLFERWQTYEIISHMIYILVLIALTFPFFYVNRLNSKLDNYTDEQKDRSIFFDKKYRGYQNGYSSGWCQYESSVSHYKNIEIRYEENNIIGELWLGTGALMILQFV